MTSKTFLFFKKINMQESVAILCAGGPAPGINTVISTIAKVFLKDGYRVLGIHEGYKNLFNGRAEVVNINFHYADRIFPRGGSTLRMSRYKPKDEEFSPDFFVENNVVLLVTRTQATSVLACRHRFDRQRLCSLP